MFNIYLGDYICDTQLYGTPCSFYWNDNINAYVVSAPDLIDDETLERSYTFIYLTKNQESVYLKNGTKLTPAEIQRLFSNLKNL